MGTRDLDKINFYISFSSENAASWGRVFKTIEI